MKFIKKKQKQNKTQEIASCPDNLEWNSANHDLIKRQTKSTGLRVGFH